MAFYNQSTGELHCKIVYYGPGFGGKTSNLIYVHKRLSAQADVKLTTLATEGDRTLYFDLLPLDLGNIMGFRTRFHLYTVPGQPRYRISRQIILQGVDGVVFVADSSPNRLFQNRESLIDLRTNLALTTRTLASLPLIYQYNKRDIPGAVAPEQLNALLGSNGTPVIPAVASEGTGVLETLKAAVGAVVGELSRTEVGAQQT
jgi:mutual gliding-motility protein MglA